MEEYPTTIKVAKNYNYKFWKNKPVTKFNEVVYRSNIIDPNIENKKNYAKQLNLPIGFEWKEISVKNNLDDICVFLNNNSAMSEHQKFKIEYTHELIKLALGDTNGTILMVVSSSQEIYGLIGYTINNMTVFSESEFFGVCHFLCVKKDFRKKMDDSQRMAFNAGYHYVLDKSLFFIIKSKIVRLLK